jgi:uncharacterized protein YcaQ
MLVLRGEVAISSRDSGGRLFDIADRVYPADLPHISAEEAARERAERRLASLGIARAKSVAQPVEPVDVGTVGVEARVEGVSGTWRVDPDALAQVDRFSPRTALLSPFDRLVFDRRRLEELFEYEYLLEMYKPAAKRRWGYFALPILRGDRLIGKLDAKADRKKGVLQVFAIHEDTPFDGSTTSAVHEEIRDLARWLGLEVRGAAEAS